MQITERTAGDVTILDLRGRLTWMEGDVLFKDRVADLMAKGRRRILLNLADVTYIDSAGVGAMVAKFVSLTREGGTMKLAHLTTRSHKLMVITRLNQVFETYESEKEALASFQPPQT
jgi:anti-sigma B factor antagonist